jgi:hypothetical protein
VHADRVIVQQLRVCERTKDKRWFSFAKSKSKKEKVKVKEKVEVK